MILRLAPQIVCLTLAIAFAATSAFAETTRVACLGDSITKGARAKPSESYPAQLQEILGDSYKVENFGIGGATLIKSGRPNAWQALDRAKKFAPHVVVISLGTNDTVVGSRKNWGKIGRFDADYQELIEQLAALPTKPRIVVCTPTAMVLTTQGLSPSRLSNLKERQPRLQQLCKQTRALAKKNQNRNVSLLELNAVLKDRPELLFKGDGVHPNAKGYRAIAEAVAKHVNATASSQSKPKQPNIVFFFVDDMGWQDTSVPFHTEETALNKRYRTPNMEQLVRQGIQFTQAYACSLCSPSRVSLMTGVNAARHRVTNWTLHKDKAHESRNAKVEAPKWNLNGLSPLPGVDRTFHAVTLPMLLQKAGYRTIHAGKAHFGADGTPGEDPKNLGFDVNIAGHCAGGPGSYHGKNNYSAAFRKGSRIWDVPGLDKYHGTDTYLNEALTIEANKAMDVAVTDGKPFYLYMSHYAIHAPFEPDARFLKRYHDAGLKGKAAVFASMIESMDKSLGDIMANLKRHKIEDNTIVVFMSDNGSPPGMPQNLPLKGSKLRPYEGGIRVPLIVRWPGVVKPKTQTKQYVMIEDIFPTFLEMAGVTDYKQIGGPIDGISFVPLLKQDAADYPKNRPLYWHYPNTYFQAPFSIIRQGDWKLIYHHPAQNYELFNLVEDLSEKKNRADDKPELRKKLAKQLGEFLKQANAQMPTLRSNGQPVPPPGSEPVDP